MAGILSEKVAPLPSPLGCSQQPQIQYVQSGLPVSHLFPVPVRPPKVLESIFPFLFVLYFPAMHPQGLTLLPLPQEAWFMPPTSSPGPGHCHIFLE